MLAFSVLPFSRSRCSWDPARMRPFLQGIKGPDGYDHMNKRFGKKGSSKGLTGPQLFAKNMSIHATLHVIYKVLVY